MRQGTLAAMNGVLLDGETQADALREAVAEWLGARKRMIERGVPRHIHPPPREPVGGGT